LGDSRIIISNSWSKERHSESDKEARGELSIMLGAALSSGKKADEKKKKIWEAMERMRIRNEKGQMLLVERSN